MTKDGAEAWSPVLKGSRTIWEFPKIGDPNIVP